MSMWSSLVTAVVLLLLVVGQSSSVVVGQHQRQTRSLDDADLQRSLARDSQVVDNAEEDDWPPAAVVDVNLRRSPLIGGDYEDVDRPKRYMRFGRRVPGESDVVDKRYMRFGRAHYHPLFGLTKRYMRFGRRR